MALIALYLNSYPRQELNYDTPLSRAMRALPKELIIGLGLSPIPPDEVVMKPKLIKHVIERQQFTLVGSKDPRRVEQSNEGLLIASPCGVSRCDKSFNHGTRL